MWTHLTKPLSHAILKKTPADRRGKEFIVQTGNGVESEEAKSALAVRKGGRCRVV
jgi:hypothetical protein